MAIIASTLARIKSDPLSCLGGRDRVNQHFAMAGHVWRERMLDPATTLLLFLLQVLHGNTAITHLRHLSGVMVAASSYCAARSRLPLEALAGLVERACGEGIESIQGAVAGPAAWLGRRGVVGDATPATPPDTPPLQNRWPQPSAQKPGCGFPILKLLGALDMATGMILHLTMMSLGSHEMSQLVGLHGVLKPGDVLLADRGFCSFVHIALLSCVPVDAVFRAHQKQIVEWVKPAAAPAWMAAVLYAALPTTVPVRELRYRIPTRGRRTRVVTIATTLLDPIRSPKRRLAELYGLRWEVETNFRHLKQTLGMDRLKCQSIDGVLKELMIFVLVYNLVRAAMIQAAGRAGGTDANRVSFIDALRWLCSCVASGSLPGETAIDLILNSIRPGRWQPRVKKRRMKEYDLMNRPRRAYAEPSETEVVMT